MSNNKESKNEARDIRLPENEESREAQREKSVRNTEKRYEAESPIDPFQDPSEEITDRAEDTIDFAENEKQDDLGEPENDRNDF